jgi:hypothetical protein
MLFRRWPVFSWTVSFVICPMVETFLRQGIPCRRRLVVEASLYDPSHRGQIGQGHIVMASIYCKSFRSIQYVETADYRQLPSWSLYENSHDPLPDQHCLTSVRPRPVFQVFNGMPRNTRSAWPKVELRFCPWLLLFQCCTGGSVMCISDESETAFF